MNLSNLWTEIENEESWRLSEIHFFQNLLAVIKSENEQAQFRRALVLILYAHFEGFCKFAFLHYIKAVNELKIKGNEANYSLTAIALADVFKALRNPQKKSDIFRRSLPDDTSLHQFARECEFLENIDKAYGKDVLISEEVIDTESNLKPEVLQKILFRLGLSHTKFDNIKDKINKLLGYRNKIAHGQSRKGISKKEYEELRDNVFFIMREVKRDVMDSLKNKQFFRKSTQ